MAVSLLCKDCNTLLKNIAEAQSHSDATGMLCCFSSPVVLLVFVSADERRQIACYVSWVQLPVKHDLMLAD
jgi:hypothetical protein